MGYEVHITRRTDWFDEEGPEITLSEWLDCIRNDPSMRLDGFAEARLPDGTVLRTESEGLAAWTGYSGHDPNGNMAWFRYSAGNITVKNPDQEILAKVVELARRLGAKAQGDEGEVYPAATAASSAGHRVKPWWRPW